MRIVCTRKQDFPRIPRFCELFEILDISETWKTMTFGKSLKSWKSGISLKSLKLGKYGKSGKYLTSGEFGNFEIIDI